MRATTSADWARLVDRIVAVMESSSSRWISRAGTSVGTAALVVIGIAYLTLSWATPALPFNADLYAFNRPASFTFVDERGELAGRRGATVGERLRLADMPAYLPAAFLVTEDRRFYRHGGIDPRGLARAAFVDIKARRFVQGGSTITQQLVKILFLTPDRTIGRKIVEMAGALQLERLLTKEQILELYLNRIYLGAGAYGVDGAARAYFGKSARDVTLAEAAMLATLTNAPSLHSPRRDLAAAQRRSARVLRALVSHGGMTEAQIAEAIAQPAIIVADAQNPERGYFLDAATEEVKSLVPSATGDLTIVTTIDPAMQAAASAAIEDVLQKRGATAQAQQAALVAMRPDGAVRAIIGGRSYSHSTFNRATNAYRSPGSGFKPLVYLTALEQGYARDTIRYDEPIKVGEYEPANYNRSYSGAITLQEALVRSINTVAVGLGQEVGLPSVIATARRLGIKSNLEPNVSLALGTSEVTPLELTGVYATFASVGLQAVPYTVTEIRSFDGTILYRRASNPPRRVIAEENALAMNAMLFEVVQSGTGRGAALGRRQVAGKTGTSAEHRDAWFVGYSADLVAGVWVGNDDYTPMKRVTGGALPAQIWRGFMQAALKNTPIKPLPKADPIYAPLVAEDYYGQGEGLFDRLGRFFDRVLGVSRAQARQEETRPQVQTPAPRADEQQDRQHSPELEPRADAASSQSPPREPRFAEERPPVENYAYQAEPSREPMPPRSPDADFNNGREAQRYAYQPEPRPQPMSPQVRPSDPRLNDEREYRERYAYQQPPLIDDRQYALERYAFAMERRRAAMRAQVRQPERFRRPSDDAGDRYAYGPEYIYPEERQGYPYGYDPRDRGVYGYPPNGYYSQQRPEPRYFDRRYGGF
jgi:penicillin-binding protein 1A